ncbi:choice-of-anchor D domain-containing protein [Leptospira wolffii]|uniref:choice-of-anchor D domain-containing protein n=1 Tax=Leptospira wolffii TaxID=409998 RepID=UPI00108367DC|nr:choice-of-anchor D domain-containing protein [Leptospira wolffii]TGK56743.1 choice-of-anchor D domain-containing protein [Leptospira wolffii]TGK71675.1 choice-of-anchor D domain-containing protein [Leptospira wolffii]TGK75468.1 choice-of-anchor D domain-containing protein [Leptospira wolffii]TGL33042.1 choice-of-anchor D domain-containing protein [Leptospira wolffii]
MNLFYSLKRSSLLLTISFAFLLHCPGGKKGSFLFFPSSEPSVHGLVIKESGREYPTGSVFNLGNVIRNTQGNTIRFSLVNQGDTTVTVSGVSITGTHSAQFVLATPPGASILEVGDNTTFELQFTPDNTVGVKTAVFNVVSDDQNAGNYALNLTGTSVLAPAPRIEVFNSTEVLTDNSPGSTQTFSTQENTHSSVKTLTIKNTGNLNLTLSNPVDLSGSDASFFSITQPSKTILTPGQSTSFTAQFHPTDTTVRNAIVQIYSNDPNITSFRILLKGTGTPTPVPKIEVTYTNNSSIIEDATTGIGHTFSFGSLFPNITSPSKSVTIKNIGDVGTTLIVSSASLSDTTNFTVFFLSSGTLTKTSSGFDPATTLSVYFNPKSHGTKTATLTIYSQNGASGSASTSTIELTGVGGKRDVQISWTNSKEEEVHRTNGGYILCNKKDTNFTLSTETGVSCITVPYVSGPFAPNSAVSTVGFGGNYYFRVKAFSEKNSDAKFSVPITVNVVSPSP